MRPAVFITALGSIKRVYFTWKWVCCKILMPSSWTESLFVSSTKIRSQITRTKCRPRLISIVLTLWWYLLGVRFSCVTWMCQNMAWLPRHSSSKPLTYMYLSTGTSDGMDSTSWWIEAAHAQPSPAKSQEMFTQSSLHHQIGMFHVFLGRVTPPALWNRPTLLTPKAWSNKWSHFPSK